MGAAGPKGAVGAVGKPIMMGKPVYASNPVYTDKPTPAIAIGKADYGCQPAHVSQPVVSKPSVAGASSCPSIAKTTSVQPVPAGWQNHVSDGGQMAFMSSKCMSSCGTSTAATPQAAMSPQIALKAIATVLMANLTSADLKSLVALLTPQDIVADGASWMTASTHPVGFNVEIAPVGAGAMMPCYEPKVPAMVCLN